MRTVAEPHVKRELNHLQARLGQNATAAVYGQKKLLAASKQVHASTEKVETVDATAEWTDDKVGRRNRPQRERCWVSGRDPTWKTLDPEETNEKHEEDVH